VALERTDYDDHTEGIVDAALATAMAAARAGPPPDDPGDCHAAEVIAPSTA
jgi:hypothetical protein